jgi:hypothetical protein
VPPDACDESRPEDTNRRGIVSAVSLAQQVDQAFRRDEVGLGLPVDPRSTTNFIWGPIEHRADFRVNGVGPLQHLTITSFPRQSYGSAAF